MGDRNTKFYHSVVRGRRRKNGISCLELGNGNIVTEEHQITKLFVEHYKNIYTTAPTSDLIATLGPKVLLSFPKIQSTEEPALCAQPSDEEIRTAFWSIGPDKAPGPDGLSARFIRTNWDTLGPVFSQEIVAWFTTKSIPARQAHTNLVLVPKTKNPMSVTQYRPISVSNVIYKTFAKILSLRLKHLLPNLISSEQTAFLKGREISENTILVREILHSFDTQRFTSQAFLMKTDLTKAFDLMSWKYVKQVLQQFAFPQPFIDLLMACVTSPTYTLLINGSGSGSITPTRGLRQGCPLSPYLFILAMEPMALMFKNGLSKGTISGIKLAPFAPHLTTTLYADDLMVMGQANPIEIEQYLCILTKFAAMSGQTINPIKIKFWFSKATTQQMKDLISQTFGGAIANHSETYLGLPLHSSKLTSCDNLIAKLTEALGGWKMTMLSQAGRLILIKSVLMSIPVYQMSTQTLNRRVVSKINALIRNFFWGKTNTKYLSLCSWKKITQPFYMGGLGLRDIRDFNRALTCKLAWKLQTAPDKPWCKVLKAKYFPRRNFWHANFYSPASITWKTICKIKADFTKHVNWSIGDGNTCSAIGTPWVIGWELFNPTTIEKQQLKVAHLYHEPTQTWDIQQLMENFNLQITLQILSDSSKRPVATGQKDRLIWLPANNGFFTVKSAYKSLQENMILASQPGLTSFNFMWNFKQIQPKVKIFLWKLCSQILPTVLRLSKRIPTIDPICPRCKERDETDYHIFFSCTASRAAWFISPLSIRSDRITQSVPEFLEHIFQTQDPSNISLFCNILWSIWEHRNQWVFSQKMTSPESILNRAQTFMYATNIEVPDTDNSHQNFSPQPLFHNMGINIYTDGAWNLNAGGWGFLIYNGTTLSCFECGNIENSPSPMQAEALAIINALDSLKKTMHQDNLSSIQVSVHSDCNNLVRALNNSAGKRQELLDWRAEREFFQIIHLAQSFNRISFNYIPRESNTDAHNLASFGRTFQGRTGGFHFPTYKPP
ncbi:RNA-directed DNA polymerase (reverse transcriptase)-related family protein [Rhynchospora pubera]|uniref:RNA-directed DNA polymerase (Reverse transcriptase)-related family protein n=1 Tax=Rhynchospora pubera TaxID=906938 RepID=A0AAV8E9M7_9POAL|nr:RNA-directed DNA polymerase (reverse transcriptase)-related family protein [Rhynchospora pubera]